MRLIIAGGRDYLLTPDDYAALDQLHRLTPVDRVLSGTQRGVDKCGEHWAKKNNIPVALYYPDWTLYGKKAGPIRNDQMAAHADALAVFPGNRGTASMRKIARRRRLKIYDFAKRELQPEFF